MSNPLLARSLAIAYGMVIILFGLRGERVYHPEELGTWDASYMVANYNVMANPAYEYLGEGNWRLMYTHPPTHYLLTGIIFKWLPVQLTLAFFPVFYFLLILYFTMRMNCPAELKIAIMTAAFALIISSLGFHVNFGVRPELNLTLCWLAGITALEAARREAWRKSLLFTGTALLTLSATYHYWGFPAVGGCIMLTPVLFNYGWHHFKNRIFTVITAGLFIAIPFAIFFVLPYLDKLIEMSSASEPAYDMVEGTWWNNLIIHLQTHYRVNGIDVHPFTPGVLHRLYIPVGLVALAGLFLIRQTRFIAWLASPLIIALVFIIKNKKAYYIFPEWTLFYLLIVFLLIRLLWWLKHHYFYKLPVNGILISGLILYLTIAVIASPLHTMFDNREFPRIHGMDIARAAARKITGDDAIVCGMLETWYTSGGKYWLGAELNLMLNPPEDVYTIIDRVDYLTAYDLDSNEQWDIRIPALYVCNDIRIKGAVFGPNQTSHVVFTRIHPEQKCRFFLFDADSVYSFYPDVSGRFAALTLLTDKLPSLENFKPLCTTSLFTNLAENERASWLTVAIFRHADAMEIQKHIPFHIKDLIRVNKQAYSYAGFMQTAENYAVAIKFVRDTVDFNELPIHRR